MLYVQEKGNMKWQLSNVSYMLILYQQFIIQGILPLASTILYITVHQQEGKSLSDRYMAKDKKVQYQVCYPDRFRTASKVGN
jgi:hypothetical protein